ncbi:hypothetical protein TrRE_jg10166, partial [Triparma retinervis]
SRMRDDCFPTLITVRQGCIPDDKGTPQLTMSRPAGLRGTLKSTMSKIKEKALRPSMTGNAAAPDGYQRAKVRSIFNTSIEVHASPVELANVFFDPLYYESSHKARRSVVHEYVGARDIVVYLAERRNAGVSKGVKMHEFLCRYMWKKEGDDYIVTFESLEDASIPFIFEKSAMAKNRVVKVRSTGYLRISPARDGASLLTITSTLNSFRQQGTQLPKVTEKDPHLPERTVLEMRAILRMLLRLKDDFDKSAAIDSYFFKKLIDTEVRHPPKLNAYEVRTLKEEGLKWRAIEEDIKHRLANTSCSAEHLANGRQSVRYNNCTRFHVTSTQEDFLNFTNDLESHSIIVAQSSNAGSELATQDDHVDPDEYLMPQRISYRDAPVHMKKKIELDFQKHQVNLMLEDEFISDAWKRTHAVSPTSNIDKFERYEHANAGSTRWTKFVTTIPTSASLVFAYIWAYDSEERMRIHEVESTKAVSGESLNMSTYIPRERRSLTDNSDKPTHSQVILETRRFPQQYHNRKRETYQMWDKVLDEEGCPTFFVVSKPLKEALEDDDFDILWRNQVEKFKGDFEYGADTKLVMSSIKGVTLLKEISKDVCEITLISTQDCNIFKTPWIKELVDREMLDLIDDLQRKFQRNWMFVDAEIRNHFMERLLGVEGKSGEELEGNSLEVARSVFAAIDHLNGAKSYDEDETYSCMFKRFDSFSVNPAIEWRPMASPSPLVSLSLMAGLSKKTICRGIAIIDASPAEVCAHFFNNTSPTRMNSFFDTGNIARVTAHTNAFNDKVVATMYKPKFGKIAGYAKVSKPLEEKLRMIVGGPSEEKLAIWMKPADEHVEYGSGVPKKTINSYFTGVIVAENYVHAGDVAVATKVTFYCSVNKSFGVLNGQIDLMVPLTTLVDAKKEMDRSEIIDDDDVSFCTDLMSDDLEAPSPLPEPSSPDNLFVESLKKHFDAHNDDANFKDFLDSDSRSRSYFVRIRRKNVLANAAVDNSFSSSVRRKSSLFTSTQNNTSVYKTQAVYDAEVQDAAAAYWVCNSRKDLEKYFSDDGSSCSVLELNIYRVGPRCQIREIKLKTRGRWAGKVFRLVEKMVWTQVSKNTIVVSHGSAEHEWWDCEKPKAFDNTARVDVEEDQRRYGRWEINLNHRLDGERGKVGSGNKNFLSGMDLEVNEVTVFRALEPLGETSQTSVTSLLSVKQKSELVNFLKREAEEQICLNRISRFTWLRTRLDKSLQIDAHARSKFKLVIKEKSGTTDLSHAYTDIEKIMISQGVLLLNQFENARRHNLRGFEHTSVEHELAIIKPQDVGMHGGHRRQSNDVLHRYNSNESGRSSSSGGSSVNVVGPLGKLTAAGSSSDQGLLLQDVRSTEALKTTLKAASLWARSRFVVNASIEDAVSYYWCFSCRCRLKETDVERKVLTIHSPYSVVGQMITKSSIKAAAQQCMFNMMWYAIDPQNILVVSFPKDAIMYTPSIEGARRVNKIWVANIKSLGDGTKCRVTYMCGQEGVHRRIRVNTRTLAVDLKDSMNSRWYFLGLKDLKECDEIVGHGIGEEFCALSRIEEEMGTKDVAARVNEVIAYNKSLTHLVVTYPWFVSMLTAILENRLRHATVVNVSPHDLSNRQARNIGYSFTFSLVTCLLPSSAVDEWILKSRAMQEFDMEFHWFRPMLDSMAFKLLHDVAWGLKFRVFVGASICVGDVVSDVYMIYYFFFQTGNEGRNMSAGMLTAIFLGMSIFLQLCIVHFNGRKDNWREKLIVIFFLKPLVDAWRIVKTGGNDLSDTRVFSPVQEAVFCKFVEMIFESIPASLVQALAYLKLIEDGLEETWMPVVSIALGCMSTGYILTSVAYDLDIDPTKRSNFECRGWVPNGEKGRLYCFVFMLLTASMQCFQTAFGFAMLYFVYRKSAALCALVIFINLPLWLIIKILRREWTCWIPIYGKSGQICTVVFRVCMSLLSMFSSSPFFADPTYTGSLYIPSMVVLQGTCWYLFETTKIVALEDGGFIGRVLYAVSIALPLSVALMFWVGIKRSKLKYFFMAPKQEDMYLKAWTLSENAGKMDMVINTHESMFSGCTENIKNWIQDNWETWKEDETFSPEILSRIPENFVPVELREETHPAIVDEGANDVDMGRTSMRPSIRHFIPSSAAGDSLSGRRRTKRVSAGKGRMPRRTVLAGVMQQVLKQNTGEILRMGSSNGVKRALRGAEEEYVDNWEDVIGERKLGEINKGGGGKKGAHRNSNFAETRMARMTTRRRSLRGAGGRRKSLAAMGRRKGVAAGQDSKDELEGDRRDSAVQERVRLRRQREQSYRERGDV